MKSEAQELIALDPEAKTLAEAAFRRLRADILLGRFRPTAKLRVEQLKSSLGVSGSSIREALSRLTAAGLVTAEGQRGFRVANVSVDDLLDLTKNRIWTEVIALRSAIARGDRNWEAEVLAAAHRLGTEQPKRDPRNTADLDENWVLCHRAFHSTLVSACHSPQLLQYRALLHDLSDRYKRLSGMRGREGRRDLAAEHKALTEAVLDRDADCAAACIEDHFLLTAESTLICFGNVRTGVATIIEQLRAELRAGMSQRGESDQAILSRLRDANGAMTQKLTLGLAMAATD